MLYASPSLGTIVNPCVLLRSSSTVTYLFCPPSVALGNAQQEWLDLRIHSSTRRWRLPGLQCLSKSEPWTHSDLTHTLLNHTQFTLFSLAFCYGLSKHGIEQTSWQRRWMFLQICDTCGGSFWTTITFLLISYLYKFTNIFFSPLVSKHVFICLNKINYFIYIFNHCGFVMKCLFCTHYFLWVYWAFHTLLWGNGFNWNLALNILHKMHHKRRQKCWCTTHSSLALEQFMSGLYGWTALFNSVS